MEMHLVWVGDYSVSVASETTLVLPWIWKGSLPDAKSQPDDVTLLASNVAAHANDKLIPQGVTVRPMKYEEPLNTSAARGHLGKGITHL